MLVLEKRPEEEEGEKEKNAPNELLNKDVEGEVGNKEEENTNKQSTTCDNMMEENTAKRENSNEEAVVRDDIEMKKDAIEGINRHSNFGEEKGDKVASSALRSRSPSEILMKVDKQVEKRDFIIMEVSCSDS